jgi:hypothetical protein
MAECMLAELRELPLRTLELRRAIAWKDDLWNEHNTVVVTAVGQPFQSGVVLDAWRNAGRLRWAPVRMDHYPWQPKPAPPSEMVLANGTRDVSASPRVSSVRPKPPTASPLQSPHGLLQPGETVESARLLTSDTSRARGTLPPR